MATVLDIPARRAPCDPDALPARPSLGHLIREGFEVVRWKASRGGMPALAARHDGDGRPVLLVPGFFASDSSMAALRRTLAACNYAPHGWGQGMNWGARPASFTRLLGRLQMISEEARQPVAVIGWSIGGVMARELAKCRPDLVSCVVTLGAPFSGDPRANRIWRLYELIARHKVDAPPIDCAPEEKPEVPTIALWSRRDGVIAAACARGLPGECDRAVEVGSTHIGLVSAPEALAATLEALQN
ncbi:MAG: esterase/lipase family protein [Parasphingopyxis sp.]